MSENKNKIALIDGYGFVFRAFHALPPMTRVDGTPIGAVYGFTNMIIKLLANLDASHIAIVFDSGSKTFRNDIFPEYKANRPPCPDELKPQFSIIREVAEALNLSILERVGFEADDLIATVAKQASRKGFEVLVVSSDKDLMQLVDDQVTMYDAFKNKNITAKEVEAKFSVKPCQVLDVLSLMGDASDNVPGVRGIGPKTAAELINKYETLENLLDNLAEIKQEKRRQLLIDGSEKAYLSKKLISLCETIPISDNMDDYLLKNIDGEKLVNFLEKQGFMALVARVKKDFDIKDNKHLESNLFVQKSDISVSTSNKISSPNSQKSINFEDIKKIIVNEISQIKNFIQGVILNGNLVIDFEWENKHPKAVIMSSIVDHNILREVFYVNIFRKDGNNSVDDLLVIVQSKIDDEKDKFCGFELGEIMQELLPILLDNSINKIGLKQWDRSRFCFLKSR